MLLLPRCVLLHLLLLLLLPLLLLLLFLLFLLLHLFLLSEVDEHKMYYQLTALFMRRAAVFPFMARAADLNNDQPSDTHTHTQAHTCTPSHTHTHADICMSLVVAVAVVALSSDFCLLLLLVLFRSLHSTVYRSTVYNLLQSLQSSPACRCPTPSRSPSALDAAANDCQVWLCDTRLP